MAALPSATSACVRRVASPPAADGRVARAMRAARDAFDALGIDDWGQRARRTEGVRREQQAAHARRARRAHAQELQIAQMAAGGCRTGRSVSAVPLPPHVESHLYRVSEAWSDLPAQLTAALSSVIPQAQPRAAGVEMNAWRSLSDRSRSRPRSVVEQLQPGHPLEQTLAMLREYCCASPTTSSRGDGVSWRRSPEPIRHLAQQAANDALMNVLRRLDDFRGLSRFTTWPTSSCVRGRRQVARHAWRVHPPSPHELAVNGTSTPKRPRPATGSSSEQLGALSPRSAS